MSPIASYAHRVGISVFAPAASERGRGGGCGRPEMQRSSLAGSKPVPLLPKRSLADRIPSIPSELPWSPNQEGLDPSRWGLRARRAMSAHEVTQ